MACPPTVSRAWGHGFSIAALWSTAFFCTDFWFSFQPCYVKRQCRYCLSAYLGKLSPSFLCCFHNPYYICQCSFLDPCHCSYRVLFSKDLVITGAQLSTCYCGEILFPVGFSLQPPVYVGCRWPIVSLLLYFRIMFVLQCVHKLHFFMSQTMFYVLARCSQIPFYYFYNFQLCKFCLLMIKEPP